MRFVFAILCFAVACMCYNNSAPLLPQQWSADISVSLHPEGQEEISALGRISVDYTAKVIALRFPFLKELNDFYDLREWRSLDAANPFNYTAVRPSGSSHPYTCTKVETININTDLPQDLLRTIPYVSTSQGVDTYINKNFVVEYKDGNLSFYLHRPGDYQNPDVSIAFYSAKAEVDRDLMNRDAYCHI